MKTTILQREITECAYPADGYRIRYKIKSDKLDKVATVIISVCSDKSQKDNKFQAMLDKSAIEFLEQKIARGGKIKEHQPLVV